MIQGVLRENFIKNAGRVLYHVVVIAVSAGIAFSLPMMVSFLAQNILVYWDFIGNEKLFLTLVEVFLAVFLILITNYVSRSWQDRKFSAMAKEAGFFLVSPLKGFWTRRRLRKLKEKQGFGREVLLVGSTGFRTFADSGGDLHQVLKNCRQAKIMLLDPRSEGAKTRVGGIMDPQITLDSFGGQIAKSISFLKTLKAGQKEIKLKLYQDAPLLKLTILGDYIWMQHYHAGMDVRMMPEYVFRHVRKPGSLYNPLYQYFVSKWNELANPEYDLETDELVYRDPSGNEARREKFGSRMENHSEKGSGTEAGPFPPAHGGRSPKREISILPVLAAAQKVLKAGHRFFHSGA